MGISVRIFVFMNGDIKQIPYAKFNRLFEGDKNESLIEFANQRIKVATVFVENQNRTPVDIIRTDCEYIKIDKDGKFDRQQQQQKSIDAMRMIDIPTIEKQPDNIIDSSSHFSKKIFKNKYLWTPTNDEIQQILNRIFKS